MHGNWDVNTPFENALELRPAFENHHFVVVDGGTHGALGEAPRYSLHFKDALGRFVTEGTTQGLPKSVGPPEIYFTAPHGSF